MAMADKHLHDLYRVQPDFVYSVSRDFARFCQTPMLVMPDDTPAQPHQTSLDIASLAPNAEATVYALARAPGAEGTDDHPKTSAVVALVQLARGVRGEAVDRGARVSTAGHHPWCRP
jgi:hypothetical protein